MNDNTETKKRPTHIIYQTSGDGENARWTRIGVAFLHKKDGKGMTCFFDAIPLDGKAVIREAKDQPRDAAQ